MSVRFLMRSFFDLVIFKRLIQKQHRLLKTPFQNVVKKDLVRVR